MFNAAGMEGGKQTKPSLLAGGEKRSNPLLEACVFKVVTDLIFTSTPGGGA